MMKREILDRAKFIETNQWLYGFLTYNFGTGTYLISHSNGWQPSYNDPDSGKETLRTPIDSDRLDNLLVNQTKAKIKYLKMIQFEQRVEKSGMVNMSQILLVLLNIQQVLLF